MDPDSRAKAKKYIKILGKILSGIAICIVVYTIAKGVHNVKDSISSWNFWYLLGALFFFLLYFVVRSTAWQSLCTLAGFNMPWLVSTWHLTSSEILRYIPGNVWGLGARVVKGPRFGIPKVQATTLLIEDAINCIVGASIVTILFLHWSAIAHGYKISLLVLSLAICCCYMAYVSSYSFFNRLIHKFFPTILLLLPHLQKRLQTLGWYVLQWAIFGIAHFFVVSMFSHSLHLATALVIGVVAWMIGYLSLITPMGLGVREGVTTTLSSYALTGAIAALFSLVSRIILIISELVFFVLAMVGFRWYEKKHPNSSGIERGS